MELEDFQPEAIEAIQFKIYKKNSIRIATFLGGPLTAGYLIGENYKAFGAKKKTIFAWLISLAVMVVVFVIAFNMADSQSTGSRYIIPLILSFIAYYVVQIFQEKEIEQHFASGGDAYSVWRAVGISLIGAVVTFVIGFAFAFVFMS